MSFSLPFSFLAISVKRPDSLLTSFSSSSCYFPTPNSFRRDAPCIFSLNSISSFLILRRFSSRSAFPSLYSLSPSNSRSAYPGSRKRLNLSTSDSHL